MINKEGGDAYGECDPDDTKQMREIFGILWILDFSPELFNHVKIWSSSPLCSSEANIEIDGPKEKQRADWLSHIIFILHP